MTAAPFPEDEALRLKALDRYRLVGLGREPAFDHVTVLAAELFDVPIALVSIVGSDMQCFRGACGIDSSGTSRDIAFCGFAILGDGVMVVENALEDPRFAGNPLVTGDPHIRFYAGAPLRVGGQAVGTLCLIGLEARDFDARQQRRLTALAKTVVDIIELRVGSLATDDSRKVAIHERELLQLTVENVTEGVALVDGKLGLILWNEAFVDMFGYSPDQVVEGGNAGALMRITAERGELGPGDPDAIVAALAASIQTTEARRLEVARNDGRILDVWRKSIAGGRFILTARDVTDERHIARLKDELVSTVSHELRTPLTAISGSLGLMASGAAGELPPKAAKLVEIAHKNSHRLARLVNDLLDLDKLQSGSAEFQFADTDLGGLLNEAAEQNMPFAERFNVSLKVELPSEAVVASVDADRVQQVITNLVSNACKFSPQGGEVCLRLTSNGETARISVIDQGPGISPEFRQRLFNRFAQEDASNERGQPGTGLGLAISKSIVEYHGGDLELDPDTTSGSTFHVDLPLKRD